MKKKNLITVAKNVAGQYHCVGIQSGEKYVMVYNSNKRSKHYVKDINDAKVKFQNYLVNQTGGKNR